MVNKTVQQFEDSLTKKIEEFSFIVNGLENHAPYQKAVDRFKVAVANIDRNWHLIMDNNKMFEARVTKMAANSVITFVEDMKGDIRRLNEELAKLRNPETVIHKDYDPN